MSLKTNFLVSSLPRFLPFLSLLGGTKTQGDEGNVNAYKRLTMLPWKWCAIWCAITRDISILLFLFEGCLEEI